MTADAAVRGADLVLWPESAVPYRIDDDPAYREVVERMASQFEIEIVLNSVASIDGGGYANSAFLVTAEGVSPVRYDKIHLVPFGEFVPRWARFAFADSLVREVGAFTPGTRPVVLPARVPLAVAICFEVVFPDHPGRAGPCRRPALDDPHQRRLVRFFVGPPPAPRPGQAARRRDSPLVRTGRTDRDLRFHRPHRQGGLAARRRRDRIPDGIRTTDDGSHAACPIRRLVGNACVPWRRFRCSLMSLFSGIATPKRKKRESSRARRRRRLRLRPTGYAGTSGHGWEGRSPAEYSVE